MHGFCYCYSDESNEHSRTLPKGSYSEWGNQYTEADSAKRMVVLEIVGKHNKQNAKSKHVSEAGTKEGKSGAQRVLVSRSGMGREDL